MRISDWSSDVCSSDLPTPCRTPRQRARDRTAKCRSSVAARNHSVPIDRGLRLHSAELRQQIWPRPHAVRAVPPATPHDHRPACRLQEPRLPSWPRLRPVHPVRAASKDPRSEEHTSELQSLMRISYAVFCLKKKKTNTLTPKIIQNITHN